MMFLDHLPSIGVGRLGGIPVRFDVTALLVPFTLFPMLLISELWQAAAVTPMASNLAMIWGIKIAGTFVSILLHELGHAAVARTYGVGTSEIRIGGFYGLALMNAQDITRRSAIPILLAGPLASAVTAAWIWLSLGMPAVDAQLNLDDPSPGSIGRPAWHYAIVWLFHLNVGIMIFNLLPAFPLDGGRAMRLAMRSRIGERRAVGIIAGLGVLVGVWSVLGAIRYGGVLAWVGVFLVILNLGIWKEEVPAPED